MNVEVIVPYDGSAERSHGFRLVREQFADCFPDVPFRMPEMDDSIRGTKPFLVNDWIQFGSRADIVVLNDADSLVMVQQLRKAIMLACEEPGIVFAYTRYRRLSKEASERARFPVDVFLSRDEDVEWEMELSGSHGCVAFRRECFLEAGGLDLRFGTAGYEDLAFNVVCESLWPSRRVAGDLFHIWHPRGWDADPANERRNRELYERDYVANFGNREALLGLVAAR